MHKLLISKFNHKLIISFAVKNVLIFIIITYMLIFLLGPVLINYTATAAYKYAAYDVILNGAMHSYNESLIKNGNIKRLLEVSTYWVSFEFESKDKKLDNGTVFAVNEKSLASVWKILIPQRLFIQHDNTIMAKENAIYISRDLSMQLKVSCGDFISTSLGSYQVAGVFENSLKRSHAFDGIILENRTEIINNNTDFSTVYTYIEFNNAEKGLNGIKNCYFNQSRAFEQYGMDWQEQITQQEIERFKSSSYKIRAVSLTNIKDSLSYNRLESIVHVSIGLFLLMTVQIYDNHKTINLNLKKIAVLRVCGCSVIKIYRYYFIKSTAAQILILTVSLIFCKYCGWIYHYLSNAILLSWAPVFMACIVISSAIIGVFCANELKIKRLIPILQSEA